MSLESFIHTFVAAEDASKKPILLLHRTGVDENVLVPWAKDVWPGSALIAPRGRVMEEGKPRFFRRVGQAQFDVGDLKAQTAALDQFVDAVRGRYGLEAPIAMGHSNGANIAWSLMFSRPSAFSGAVLLRPLMPIVPEHVGEMHGLPVLILSGSEDRIASPEAATALPQRLRMAGANVSHVFLRAKHDLVAEDCDIARAWLNSYFSQR